MHAFNKKTNVYQKLQVLLLRKKALCYINHISGCLPPWNLKVNLENSSNEILNSFILALIILKPAAEVAMVPFKNTMEL